MKRYLAALLLGLILLAASAVVWAFVGQVSFGRDSTQLAVTRIPGPLGVNVALETLSSSDREATLDAIAAAGFGWIRQRFDWNAIEAQPGDSNWQTWDAIVDGAAARGLEVVAVLDGAPAWARLPEDTANPLAPPARRADFGNFAAAVAQRYGDRLRFYQIWDEPNIAPHWGSRFVDAADYAGLLREATVQVRGVDSDAVIVAAALAPNVEAGGLNQSDLAFLSDLYQAGGASWFDLAAAQPYGFDLSPDDPPDPARLNFRRAELLRQVMVDNGDAGSRLLMAAYGWHATASGDPTVSPWKSVSPERQAQWATEAADWARRNWPWSAGMAWAWWQPPQPASDPHWGFALETAAGDSGQAQASLQQWNLATHPLGTGIWAPDDPAVSETGGWRLTGQAADPPHGAAGDDNVLVVPFEGTGLAVQIQRGPFWGYLDATVDGQPANALPRDGDRAILVLHDPLGDQELVTIADGLTDGAHQVELRATGGWEQWPLLSFVVSNETARRWPVPLGWILGIAGLLLSGVGVAGLARRDQDLTVSASRQSLFGGLDGIPVAGRYAALLVVWVGVVVLTGWLQLVALGLLFLLFIAFPETGLFSLAASAPLFLRSVSLLGRQVNPAEMIVWLLAGALVVRLLADILLRRWRGQSLTMKFNVRGLDWPVLALLMVAALSLIAAQNFGVAAREFRTVIAAGVLAYSEVRVAPTRADGRFDPWPVVWGIGVGATVVAVWGITQAVSGVGLIDAEGVWRVRGPYGSPNNLALYVAHALPIMLAVAAFGERRRERVLAGAFSLVLTAGLLLTFSKGGLLLGVPAAVLFIGFVAGGRWRWIALGAAVVGLLALVPFFATERFASLFDLQGGTSFFRLQLWQGTWNMIKDHPWQGVGLDNFLYAYRTTYVLPAAWQEINLSHPHNVVLDFWTRLGIPGLAVGVWLFVAAFRSGWRSLGQLHGNSRAIVLGLLASLVATLAHGLIDNSLFLMDLMLLFMLTLGLLQQMERREKREREGN